MATPTDQLSPTLDSFGKRYIAKTYVLVLVAAVALFLSAGRLAWLLGWVFIGLYFVNTMVSNVILTQQNPELLNERGHKADNSKRWDEILTVVWLLLIHIIYVVAGLDAGRFGWSSMPVVFGIVAMLIFVLGTIVIVWAMISNPYFSPTVRIQEDRNHHAITAGPYQYVRHPGYVGAILWLITTPFILGSWWALIPAGLTAALFILRTKLEDDTLHAELSGYVEYAAIVRHRLFPGVW